jgi:guanine deaminase
MGDDLRWIERTVELARLSLAEGSLPFGSVIVDGDRAVAEGRNTVATTHDPTAHAELDAIRAACRGLGTPSLAGMTIYASGAPCPMCLTAMYHSQLSDLVYAGSYEDAAEVGISSAPLYDELAASWEARRLRARQVGREAARQVLAEYATRG